MPSISFDHLIIGGGQVADDAARGIRELDEDATIGILSADTDAPYTRPALSKKLWTDPEFYEDQVPLGTAEDTGAELRLETRVVSIDREARRVRTDGGDEIGYGHLLLATGSAPRELEGSGHEHVIAFRTFEDYRRLRHLADERGKDARFVVVGGGYIGTEIAAALAGAGVRTTLVHPDRVLMGSTFPAGLAERYQQLFVDAGVELVSGRRAERITTTGTGLAVVLDDAREVAASVVVLGLGADPVLDLARGAGLDVEDGVVVDEHLRTSDPSIRAAGDIAEYPDAILGRTRVEHVDSAREMGRAVGRAMAGATDPYTYTPYFYSQVLGVRWEAVGTLDPQWETVVDELGEDRRVVYYLDEDGGPEGVLLWNVEDARDAARDVLREHPTDRDALIGRIA